MLFYFKYTIIFCLLLNLKCLLFLKTVPEIEFTIFVLEVKYSFFKNLQFYLCTYIKGLKA